MCVGKLYEDIQEYINAVPVKAFSCYNQSWTFVEFGNRLKSWGTFRRCIFTSRETEDDGQLAFEFARPDSVIYSNLGQNKELDEKLVKAGGGDFLKAEGIIKLNHSRGRGELVHRSEKEFVGREQLPFERFGMNRAFYYFMLMSHFLYESYKRDILSDVMPINSYPNTFRRLMIDFAAKIVSTAGYIILKVTHTVYDTLKIAQLWTSIQEQQSAFVT